MRRRFKIHGKARTLYLSRDVVRDGFEGEVDGYANAVTLTLVHPEANLEDVEDSLKVVLEDTRLRRKMQQRPEWQGGSKNGKRTSQ